MNEVFTQPQKVIGQIAELQTLLAGFAAQSAASLDAAAVVESQSLSNEEMERRVEGALAALRGETQCVAKTPPVVQSNIQTTNKAIEFAFLSEERAPFESVYSGQHSTLEVRPGIYGKREVRFVLKGGLDSLRAAVDEINLAIKSANNYPKEGFKICLSGNNDLPNGRDIITTWTPVIKDSGNRVRGEGNSDPEISHEALLNSLGLKFVNNDIHRLACGALRISKGFPEDMLRTGNSDDPGDLNEGLIVRTAKGPRSGAVGTSLSCVVGRDWDWGESSSSTFVAGAYA